MTRINRREFVQSTMAIGAGLFVAPVIGRSQSPNEKLGVAVVGVGGRGGDHLQGYMDDPRTEVRIIVDIDEKIGNSRCESVEKKQGSRPRLVADMREAFDSPDIELVSTATPNHWHALCGIWAMQAGKDAYIEKPVCHDIAEGSALVAAARKYNRMCQVGTQCRSSAAVRDGIAFMESGGIGKVNFARGLCWKRRASIGALGDYQIPESVNFGLWTGPAPETNPKLTRPKFHYDWHWQRLYGNGDLGNQGPHQTDIARWGLGLDRHPNSVMCYGGRLGYQAERKDPSYVDAGDTGNTEVSIYDYGDKCIVFETRGLDVKNSADDEINRLFDSSEGNRVGVIFYGTDGYLVQATYTHCIAYDKDFNVIKEFKGGGDHFGNFIDACVSRDHRKLNADVREGHLSAAISHLGNISYYMGEQNRVPVEEARRVLSDIKSLDDNVATLDRTVQHLQDNGVDQAKYPISLGPRLQFDPEAEVFPSSKEATAMVSREYRKGFECPTKDKV